MDTVGVIIVLWLVVGLCVVFLTDRDLLAAAGWLVVGLVTWPVLVVHRAVFVPWRLSRVRAAAVVRGRHVVIAAVERTLAGCDPDAPMTEDRRARVRDTVEYLDSLPDMAGSNWTEQHFNSGFGTVSRAVDEFLHRADDAEDEGLPVPTVADLLTEVGALR